MINNCEGTAGVGYFIDCIFKDCQGASWTSSFFKMYKYISKVLHHLLLLELY